MHSFQKNYENLLVIFFSKKDIWHTYVFTKCIDNFKFTISLKSNEEQSFAWVPPNACLFSIMSFVYGWQKIFMDKNIVSKHNLHVLFISFFCKLYNKEKLFTAIGPLNVDLDHNHDFQLLNCINVEPNDLLITQLSTMSLI